MSEKYKVIDEKIIPTFKNNELAIVYVKMLKGEPLKKGGVWPNTKAG